VQAHEERGGFAGADGGLAATRGAR
jgi:hypothetical protein